MDFRSMKVKELFSNEQATAIVKEAAAAQTLDAAMAAPAQQSRSTAAR